MCAITPFLLFPQVEAMGVADLKITCGAICVYSSRVPDAKKALQDAKSNVPIASVAAGFPAGECRVIIQPNLYRKEPKALVGGRSTTFLERGEGTLKRVKEPK